MKKLLFLSLLALSAYAYPSKQIARFNALLDKNDAAGALKYFKSNIFGEQDRKTALLSIISNVSPQEIDKDAVAQKTMIELIKVGGANLRGTSVSPEWYHWITKHDPKATKYLSMPSGVTASTQMKTEAQPVAGSAGALAAAKETKSKTPIEQFKAAAQTNGDDALALYKKLSAADKTKGLTWVLDELGPKTTEDTVEDFVAWLNKEPINTDLRKISLNPTAKTWLGDNGVRGFEEFETPPPPPANPAD